MTEPTPVPDPDQAWDMMFQRAMDLLRMSEMDGGLPPMDGDNLELMQAGISLGIAAAAGFYKDNPEAVPQS